MLIKTKRIFSLQSTTDGERSNLNLSNKSGTQIWVKNDHSANLLKFINNITKDLKDHLKTSVLFFWNNLDNDQREALLNLANDPSITIKPADKGGSIVITNADDYMKSCLNSLSDPNFYEELPADPNPKYRTDLDEKIDDSSSNIINEFEASKLQDYTKSFTNFLLYNQYVVDSTPVLQSSPNLLIRF